MNWLREAWDGLLQWLVPSRRPYKTVRVEDLPEVLHPRRVYVAGEGEHRWYAGFLCPCGCGATIQLSLLRKGRPRWELSEDKRGRPTLHPSVRGLKGCKSHFWLRRGRVEWCDAKPSVPARAAARRR